MTLDPESKNKQDNASDAFAEKTSSESTEGLENAKVSSSGISKGAWLFLPLLVLTIVIAGFLLLSGDSLPGFEELGEFQRGFMQAISKNQKDASDYANSYIKNKTVESGGFIQMAGIAYRNGQYEDARLNYSSAIEADPENYNLYLHRAQCNLQIGKNVIALQDCATAESKGAQGVFLNRVRMMAFAQSRRFNEALRACNLLLVLDMSDRNYVLTERAQIYELMGRVDEALSDLNQVIEKDPESVRALVRRAYLHHGLKQFDKQAEDVKKLDAVKKVNNEYDYVSRAYASLALKRYSQAIDDSNALIKNSKHRKLNALYGAIVGRLASQFAGDRQSIKGFDQYAEKTVVRPWPYPIYQYLNSEISKERLVEIAGDSTNRITEVKTYLALECELKKDWQEAKRLYEWVLNEGNPLFLEWDLSKVRLSEIDSIQKSNKSSNSFGSRIFPKSKIDRVKSQAIAESSIGSLSNFDIVSYVVNIREALLGKFIKSTLRNKWEFPPA